MRSIPCYSSVSHRFDPQDEALCPICDYSGNPAYDPCNCCPRCEIAKVGHDEDDSMLFCPSCDRDYLTELDEYAKQQEDDNGTE